MAIVTRDAPVRQRSGRAPRLSVEDMNDIVEALKTGAWAGEDEAAPSSSAAHQRGRAAIKQISAAFNVVEIVGKGKELTVAAVPVDPTKKDKKDPHYYQVGAKDSKPAKPKADGASK